MNPFDLAILITIGVCMIAGIYRGPFKELFSILAFYLGTYVAFNYCTKLAGLLSRAISNTMALKMLSFLIIFCEIYIIIIISGAIVRYLLKIELPGWSARLLGSIMGMFRGFLIVSLALIIIVCLPTGYDLLKKSKFSPYLTVVSETMAEIVSREIRDEFTNKLTDLKKTWVS